jgi:cytoskeletal protein RodZ
LETIGKLLQTLRQEKNLTLDEISRQTKIAKHLLVALENDDYKKLPASTFTKGFITSFARVVGLSSDKALAIFRRDFMVSQSGKILPKGLSKPLDKPTVVTSRIFLIGAVVVLLCIFSVYLFVQLKSYNAPPSLEVSRPKLNSIVKGPIISVKGFVSSETTVYVNGNLAQVFPTGEFQASVQLPTGEQKIEVRAVDHQNKSSAKTIPVTVVDK